MLREIPTIEVVIGVSPDHEHREAELFGSLAAAFKMFLSTSKSTEFESAFKTWRAARVGELGYFVYPTQDDDVRKLSDLPKKLAQLLRHEFDEHLKRR